MFLPSLSGVNQFPSDNIPVEKKKQKEYGQQVGMAVYSQLLQSNTLFGVTNFGSFSVWRSYANGQQSIESLRNWYTYAGVGSNPSVSPAAIDNRISPQGIDIGAPPTSGDYNRGLREFIPMDYAIISPMPKLMSTICSLILNEANYQVWCESINPLHVQQKETDAWERYYIETFARPQAKQMGLLYPLGGIFEPKSEEQVQLMRKQGAFRLLFETGFESLIKHTFNISEFSEWSEDVVRDHTTLSFACGKYYYDNDSLALKVKYIDPAKFVIQWNKDRRGRKPSYVGHIEFYSMYVVKDRMKQMGYDEQTIKEAAQTVWNTMPSSAGWPTSMWEERNPSTNRWLWEDMTVQVLEFEYVSSDEIRYKKNKDGSYSEIEEPHHRYDEKDIFPTVYKGAYILGTSFLMEWGVVPNNDGEVSYFWSEVKGASIVSRCQPIMDDLMKCVVKLRTEIYNAAPSGVYIDLSAVGNITLNQTGQQEFIQKALSAWRQTGVLLGETKVKNGKTITDKPIIPMANGPVNIDAYANMMAYQMNLALDMSGIPEILAATPTQSPEKAVRIGEIEVISGNHALWTIKKAYMNFMEMASKKILGQIRRDIRFSENSRKYYEGIIGSAEMRAVMAVKNLTQEELAITLKVLPNVKQKAEMKLSLLEASKAGNRDGLKTLTEVDLMICNRLINDDLPALAEMYAAIQIDENRKRYEEQASAAIKENADANATSAERIELAKQKTLEMEINLAGIVKERLLKLDKETPSAEIAQKGQIESQQIDQEGAWQAATGQNIKNPRK